MHQLPGTNSEAGWPTLELNFGIGSLVLGEDYIRSPFNAWKKALCASRPRPWGSFWRASELKLGMGACSGRPSSSYKRVVIPKS